MWGILFIFLISACVQESEIENCKQDLECSRYYEEYFWGLSESLKASEGRHDSDFLIAKKGVADFLNEQLDVEISTIQYYLEDGVDHVWPYCKNVFMGEVILQAFEISNDPYEAGFLAESVLISSELLRGDILPAQEGLGNFDSSECKNVLKDFQREYKVFK